MRNADIMKLLGKVNKNELVTKEEKSDTLSSNKVIYDFSSLVYEDSGKTIETLIRELAELFVDSLYYEFYHEKHTE